MRIRVLHQEIFKEKSGCGSGTPRFVESPISCIPPDGEGGGCSGRLLFSPNEFVRALDEVHEW